MKEEITLRVVGSKAFDVVRPFSPRAVSKNSVIFSPNEVYEITLPLRSEATRNLFQGNATGSPEDRGWFITHRTIRRSYSQEELDSSVLYHVMAQRVFAEAVGTLDHFLFDSNGNCAIPVSQITPIVLSAPIKSKDVLVRLSEGSWVCRPEFASQMTREGFSQVKFLPVFESRAKMESHGGYGGVRDIAAFFLEPMDFEANRWLQMVISSGPFTICEPTDARNHPYVDDKPEDRCDSQSVYGPNLLSEVTVRSEGVWAGDFFHTNNFIGTSGGVYLPMQELLITRRAFMFLQRQRIKSLEIDRANIE